MFSRSKTDEVNDRFFNPSQEWQCTNAAHKLVKGGVAFLLHLRRYHNIDLVLPDKRAEAIADEIFGEPS